MKTILVVDDEQNMCKVLKMVLEKDGYTVCTAYSGKEALKIIAEMSEIDLVISDLRMPDMNGMKILEYIKETGRSIPFIVISAFGSVQSAVDAMKLGAVDFIIKPFKKDVIRLVVRRVFHTDDIEKENEYLKNTLEQQRVVYQSRVMKRVMEIARQAGPAPTPVLLLGESGTGKGVIAKAIHEFGVSSGDGAKARPFIEINCPAIPETLFESELFGYRKGAFTGASKDLLGKVHFADGGTLFFDEIGELPLGIQAKLLKLIEEKTYEPLGRGTGIHLNARVICATNRDLPQLVKEKRFRSDLFYRINGITITVPALRERKEDLVPLADFFLGKYRQELGKEIAGLSESALESLMRYDWPGNVRELRNVIERAVVLCKERYLRLADLPAEIQTGIPAGDSPVTNKLEDTERRLLTEALERCNGNISRAARDLGITRNTLRYRMQKYGLSGGL